MSQPKETNRDKALRGEVVLVTDGRLKEMQKQCIQQEGVGWTDYHWYWATAMNELVARRALDHELTARPCERPKPITHRLSGTVVDMYDCGTCLPCRARALETP